MMLDSDTSKQTVKIFSPLPIAAFIQAALSLAVIAYCLVGTGHMRPILIELFQQPVIPMGLSVAMFALASVLWFRKQVRAALIVIVLWCIYDIVARAWLFDGHMSTEQHERHVSFAAGMKIYFALSLLVSVAILIGASRKLMQISRNSKATANVSQSLD